MANDEAFVPLRASVPDHPAGATVIVHTLAPAANGALYVPNGHVTLVETGLVITIDRERLEARAIEAVRATPRTAAPRDFRIFMLVTPC